MSKLFVFLFAALISIGTWANPSRTEQIQSYYHQEVSLSIKGFRKMAVSSPKLQALADRMNLHDVEVLVVNGPDGFIGGYFPGVVVLSSRLEQEAPEIAAFVIAHEYGHHLRGHWNHFMAFAMEKAATAEFENVASFLKHAVESYPTEIRHRNEYEADDIARQLLQYNKLWNEDAVIGFFLRMSHPTTDSHPSSIARLKFLELVI